MSKTGLMCTQVIYGNSKLIPPRVTMIAKRLSRNLYNNYTINGSIIVYAHNSA